jgi:Family of unknown function (DUF6498)
MSDTRTVSNASSPPPYPLRHYLLQPSTVVFIATDLVPLAGVAFWHWDAFLLLMLYGLDMVIIAFWTLARMVASLVPTEDDSHSDIPSEDALSVLGTTAGGNFFLLAMYFKTMWFIFAGPWAARIHNPDQFVRQVIVDSGLWIPLAGFMFSRGLFFLFHVARPQLLQRIERALFPRRPVRPPAPAASLSDELVALFLRVIGPTLGIGVGALLSVLLLGSPLTPFTFVFVILVKTTVDLWIHLVVDLRAGPSWGPF